MAPGSAVNDRRKRFRWMLRCFIMRVLLAPPENFAGRRRYRASEVPLA